MEMKEIRFTLNGKKVALKAYDNITLLNALREYGVTSLKRGCEEGECGACTILVDGIPQKSCMMFTFEAEGTSIITSEGLIKNGKLHTIQQVFIDEGAIQCGYCTPGMIISAYALLQKNPEPSEKDIKEALSGNLCRCTGYVSIIKAVKKSSQLMKKQSEAKIDETI
ncbi:MAG: (2Fe-2S)-binding protein [Petrotogales bacterium]